MIPKFSNNLQKSLKALLIVFYSIQLSPKGTLGFLYLCIPVKHTSFKLSNNKCLLFGRSYVFRTSVSNVLESFLIFFLKLCPYKELFPKFNSVHICTKCMHSGMISPV